MAELAETAFRNCTSVRSVTLPDQLKIISARAFQGCTKLETVSVGSCVYSIADYAFYSDNAIREFRIYVADPSKINMGNNVFSTSALILLIFSYWLMIDCFSDISSDFAWTKQLSGRLMPR